MRKDQLKPIMDFEQLYMYAAEQIQKLRLISENQTYLFDGSADGIEKVKVFLWNGFGAMAPCEDHAVQRLTVRAAKQKERTQTSRQAEYEKNGAATSLKQISARVWVMSVAIVKIIIRSEV